MPSDYDTAHVARASVCVVNGQATAPPRSAIEGRMHKPDWRSSLQPAFDEALAFLESLPERPVRAVASPEELLAAMAVPLAADPTPAPDVVRALARAADPGLTAMPGGRFFGWVIGGALPAALAADRLTSAWDQNTGSAFATPAAAVIEQIALDWIKDLLELPATSSGARTGRWWPPPCGPATGWR